MTPVPKPSRKARLKREKEARTARMLALAEVRHDVIVRADGRCEFCRRPVPPGELHHILGGIGRRRRAERADTLAFICLGCHSDYHRGDQVVLRMARNWAAAWIFPDSYEVINRRLQRALEAASAAMEAK